MGLNSPFYMRSSTWQRLSSLLPLSLPGPPTCSPPHTPILSLSRGRAPLSSLLLLLLRGTRHAAALASPRPARHRCRLATHRSEAWPSRAPPTAGPDAPVEMAHTPPAPPLPARRCRSSTLVRRRHGRARGARAQCRHGPARTGRPAGMTPAPQMMSASSAGGDELQGRVGRVMQGRLEGPGMGRGSGARGGSTSASSRPLQAAYALSRGRRAASTDRDDGTPGRVCHKMAGRGAVQDEVRARTSSSSALPRSGRGGGSPAPARGGRGVQHEGGQAGERVRRRLGA
ncbi:translation initiation factor IF-2 [Triticum aestivum]|uniref:translation initiation factor IF-2 n=1 Tax=Triticum aestivum TaxID=4565 RepID=UPI001D025736|nr:translation initiation factor IF-2-like [Triticum aestivum]